MVYQQNRSDKDSSGGSEMKKKKFLSHNCELFRIYRYYTTVVFMFMLFILVLLLCIRPCGRHHRQWKAEQTAQTEEKKGS